MIEGGAKADRIFPWVESEGIDGRRWSLESEPRPRGVDTEYLRATPERLAAEELAARLKELRFAIREEIGDDAGSLRLESAIFDAETLLERISPLRAVLRDALAKAGRADG